MQKYRVPTLTTKTTPGERTKLAIALKAVRGVEKVTLHLSSNEFEIKPRDVQQQPTREELSAAASGAGFVISPKQ